MVAKFASCQVRQRQSWMVSKVSIYVSSPIWRLDFGQRTESQKIMSPVHEASNRVEQYFRATRLFPRT